jgi:hypothetical protein
MYNDELSHECSHSILLDSNILIFYLFKLITLNKIRATIPIVNDFIMLILKANFR